MEDSGYASIQSRLAAWSRLCREFGLEEIVLKTHVFQSDEPEAELMAECQQLLAAEILPRGIDALFCHSDNDALAMLGSCQAQGVACPDRLALIGWDDLPLCQLTFPPLASVNLQPEAFGVNLVHLALRQIGREEGKALPIAIDATFTCRRSAG
jgi:DNA-binding LacI/PurR family transcriptional regulator